MFVKVRSSPFMTLSHELWISVRLATILPSEWKSDQRHQQVRQDSSNFLKRVKKISRTQLEFFWQITINQINLWLMQLLLCLGNNFLTISVTWTFFSPGQGLMYGTSTGELKIVIPAGSSRNCPRLRSQDVLRNPTGKFEFQLPKYLKFKINYFSPFGKNSSSCQVYRRKWCTAGRYCNVEWSTTFKATSTCVF